MEIEQKIALLEDCALFKMLPASEKMLLAGVARIQILPAKKVFIRQGITSGSMYILGTGAVRVFVLTPDGGEINVGLRGKGELVGILSLLDDELHAANVQTLEQTTVLTLYKRDFITMLSKYPQIALKMLQYLSRSQRLQYKNLELVLSKKLEDRAWQTLLKLSEYFPNRTIILAHDDIAQIVGATRARITEVLQILQKEGKILLSHKKIKLL